MLLFLLPQLCFWSFHLVSLCHPAASTLKTCEQQARCREMVEPSLQQRRLLVWADDKEQHFVLSNRNNYCQIRHCPVGELGENFFLNLSHLFKTYRTWSTSTRSVLVCFANLFTWKRWHLGQNGTSFLRCCAAAVQRKSTGRLWSWIPPTGLDFVDESTSAISAKHPFMFLSLGMVSFDWTTSSSIVTCLIGWPHCVMSVFTTFLASGVQALPARHC